MHTETSASISRLRRLIYETGQWPDLEYCTLTSSSREKVEQYIAQIFHTSYGAKVFDYLPLLLSLKRAGQITAAMGMRKAADESLLSERYLDCSAEQAIQQVYGTLPERHKIIEFGNLVASTPGHSALLYLLAIAAMHKAGFNYILFTANQKVRASAKRCGFSTVSIAPAYPQALGAQASRWGSYYDGKPEVTLADVKVIIAQAYAKPHMRKQLQHYQLQINQLAAMLMEDPA